MFISSEERSMSVSILADLMREKREAKEKWEKELLVDLIEIHLRTWPTTPAMFDDALLLSLD